MPAYVCYTFQKSELATYIITITEKFADAKGPALGQRVMTFVAVAMIIQKYEVSYEGKVWHAICQGLSLLQFDKSHVKILLEQLSSYRLVNFDFPCLYKVKLTFEAVKLLSYSFKDKPMQDIQTIT